MLRMVCGAHASPLACPEGHVVAFAVNATMVAGEMAAARVNLFLAPTL